MNQYIKNYPREEVRDLANEVSVLQGQVVSKTLAQNGAVSITLFAFSANEEISTHGSSGDALVQVIEGQGRFIVDGKEHIVDQGQALLMPADKPHSVHADQDFKMLLTVVFPLNKDEQV